MRDERVWTQDRYAQSREFCKDKDISEVCDALEEQAKMKYCPAVKGNCLGDGCAFFTVTRPCVDERIVKAICSYAGKRTIAEEHGTTTDLKARGWG